MQQQGGEKDENVTVLEVQHRYLNAVFEGHYDMVKSSLQQYID